MRKKLLPFLFSAIILLCSCQKELTDEGQPGFCHLSGITVKDEAGNITSVYQFTYDSILRRPTLLYFEDFTSGNTKTIFPSYNKDTITLGSNSYLTLDASRRLKTLVEFNGTQGIYNADFYYTYNSEGQLSERLIDDRVNSALRTNFTFTNGNLTSFKEDLPGYPQSITGILSYAASPIIAGYSQYALLELFPELLLYMPLFQIGKLPNTPVTSLKADINVPGFPISSINITYSNYSLTNEGWLGAFETSTVVSGSSPVISKYQFHYKCYQ